MKKFIVLIITSIILAVATISCTSKVEKDIKTIVGNDVKVCAVKTIDIKENFYRYTEEYNRLFEEMQYWGENKVEWFEIKVKYENLFKDYPSAKQRLKKDYDDVVNSYQKSADSSAYYISKCMWLESEKSDGKIYVAKLLGRNEYTNKPNEYNSYSIFSYNNDGTIHPIETDEDMRIIFSVFPKAKEDLQKAMGDALGALVDAFKDIDI